MPLTGLTEGEIKTLEDSLLARVPEGDAIGNTTLQRGLEGIDRRWTTDLFWAIRNRLIERGHLERGKGKGGSVRRARNIAAVQSRPAAAEPVVSQIQAERDLYGPMIKVIKENWSIDAGLDTVIVEITAQGGRRPDGKWSRPDITLASYKTFPYVPGRHFDLITFEIKPTDTVDVTVVYEALAHRRAATRAYALLHIPGTSRAALDDVLDEIILEAKRVGVGVIVAENPANYETWEELVEAARYDPDPQRLNDFLGTQVSQGFREQFVKWFR
ncbi:MAG: hypothetical protein ABL973_13670 [Micropepsaceae bacterium]